MQPYSLKKNEMRIIGVAEKRIEIVEEKPFKVENEPLPEFLTDKEA